MFDIRIRRFPLEDAFIEDHHLPLKKRIIRSDNSFYNRIGSNYHCDYRLSPPLSSLNRITNTTTLETCSLDSGYCESEPLDLSFHSNIASSIEGSQSSPLPLSPARSTSSTSSSSSSALSECSSSSSLVCPDCNKVYESNARYRAHVRRHESKQSGRYQCNVCFKNFVQRSSLRTHERIHTGEKPYHCLVCNERFGDFSTFTKHRRTHTGEKPYSCPVCSRAFSQSGNMHRHLKVVHKPRPNLYRQLL